MIRKGLAAQGPDAVTAFDQALELLRLALSSAIHDVFLLSMGIVIAALAVAIFLRQRPPHHDSWGEAAPPAKAEQPQA